MKNEENTEFIDYKQFCVVLIPFCSYVWLCLQIIFLDGLSSVILKQFAAVFLFQILVASSIGL